MADVNSTPEFLHRRAEKEKRTKEREERFAVLEGPIVERLKTIGFDAGSVIDAVQKYSPLPKEFVDVLFEGIKHSSDLKLLEGLIRALAAARESFDGRPIVECYERFNDWNLRWVIANTIACAKPHSIDSWIDKALNDPVLGS